MEKTNNLLLVLVIVGFVISIVSLGYAIGGQVNSNSFDDKADYLYNKLNKLEKSIEENKTANDLKWTNQTTINLLNVELWKANQELWTNQVEINKNLLELILLG